MHLYTSIWLHIRGKDCSVFSLQWNNKYWYHNLGLLCVHINTLTSNGVFVQRGKGSRKCFLHYCVTFVGLTIKSSSSGRVSLRCRLERALGVVAGGSRNSFSSWRVLTRQETSPTNPWASLAVIALENPWPCRGRWTVMLKVSWQNYMEEKLITALIIHHRVDHMMRIKNIFISNGWKVYNGYSLLHYAWQK